jgi:hypothetical protein
VGVLAIRRPDLLRYASDGWNPDPRAVFVNCAPEGFMSEAPHVPKQNFPTIPTQPFRLEVPLHVKWLAKQAMHGFQGVTGSFE